MPSRSLPVVLLALCLLLVVPTTALAATEARSSARAEMVLAELVNDRRAEVGLPALTTRADLHDIARNWSFAQAEQGRMGHNPDLTSQACCWTRIAENVGRSGGHAGAGATAIAHALMRLWRDSAQHDATMTDAEVDQLGVGIVIDDAGTAWGTTVFRRCDGSSCTGGAQGPAADTSVSWAPPPPPEPAPEPEPTTEPAPHPSPHPSPRPSPSPSPQPSPSASPSPTPSPTPSPSPAVSPSPATAPPLAGAALRGDPRDHAGGPRSLAILLAGALAVGAAVATWRRRS